LNGGTEARGRNILPRGHNARTIVGLAVNSGCRRRALTDAAGVDKQRTSAYLDHLSSSVYPASQSVVLTLSRYTLRRLEPGPALKDWPRKVMQPQPKPRRRYAWIPYASCKRGPAISGGEDRRTPWQLTVLEPRDRTERFDVGPEQVAPELLDAHPSVEPVHLNVLVKFPDGWAANRSVLAHLQQWKVKAP